MDVVLALPAVVLVLIAVLLLAQVALMIWALVDAVRRPSERMRGPKWLWLLVIIFGELIGSIVYLLVARLPEPVNVAPVAPADDRAAVAADVLYGPAEPRPSSPEASQPPVADEPATMAAEPLPAAVQPAPLPDPDLSGEPDRS